MAFTSAITEKTSVISSPKYPSKFRRHIKGTFLNTSGSTGGDIHPGLRKIKTVNAFGSASGEVNASITSSTSGFTLTTDADIDGFWEAEGQE